MSLGELVFFRHIRLSLYTQTNMDIYRISGDLRIILFNDTIYLLFLQEQIKDIIRGGTQGAWSKTKLNSKGGVSPLIIADKYDSFDIVRRVYT